MSKKARITRAYCVQLGEVLSITEARREFFSLPEPRRRFEFLCSNASCRDLPVKPEITAVNYDKHPNDTYRAAHYRANDNFSHAPDCEWMIDEEAKEVDGKLPGETAEDALRRRAKRKLHDYIDTFDPNPQQATDHTSTGSTAQGGDATNGHRRTGVDRGDNLSGSNRTSNLERLVECYRQARKELSDEEFKALTLQVQGLGKMPLSTYFKRITYGKLGASNRVLYGGAGLIERYLGGGFRFRFIDKNDGKPVFLHVLSEQMKNYRFRNYLDGLLRVEGASYFSVFTLGELALSDTQKSIKLTVSDLKQLVVIPGFTQPSKANAESAPAPEV
ncbi:ATPase [Pseudomonas alcaligenes]|uniref:ATPase n=1 Tax=Aquipseudomonas alcaligenes TaxID=43263 RepID=UPI00359021D9